MFKRKIIAATLSLSAVALSGCISLDNGVSSAIEKSRNMMADVNDAYVQNSINILRTAGQDMDETLDSRNKRFAGHKEEIRSSARSYLDVIADIRATLQVGTTPGNPVLMEKLGVAASNMSSLSAEIEKLQDLSNLISKDMTQVSFLQRTVNNAMQLAGGTDEDHQNLDRIRIALDKKANDLVLMQGSVNSLIARQLGLQDIHRKEFNQLTQLIRKGVNTHSVISRPLDAPAMTQTPGKPIKGVETPNLKVSAAAPLKPALFKMKPQERNFEQALYAVVSKAYAQDQNIEFKILGVAAVGSNVKATAANNKRARVAVDRLLEALVEIGVPASRVKTDTLADTTVQETEVRLYKG